MAEPPVRRNTILLSASLAANSAMLQLSAAVGLGDEGFGGRKATLFRE